MDQGTFRRTSLALAFTLAALFLPRAAGAHCDTMDGPVVTAGLKALETGNVGLALVWVREPDETAVREAFRSAVAVRALGAEAKKMADMYFLETLVRIHREGEGVPYTGLKPAGTAVEPGIAAADAAVGSGSTSELLRHIDEAVGEGVRARYAELLERRTYDPGDLAAGRAYVAAYVSFIHYVEGIHRAAAGAAQESHDAPAAEPGGREH
jgi:hypothetical protein